MSGIPRITECYALDTGAPTGPMFDTEAEARQHPDYLRSGLRVVRCYVNAAGRIVHTENLDDPEEA